MITQDIELIEKIFHAIIQGLNAQAIEYEDIEFTYKIYDEYGFRNQQVTLRFTDSERKTDQSVGHDDSPELDYLLRKLFIQMSERGDNWKSMSLKFIDGKVTTNFSYEENPPPW